MAQDAIAEVSLDCAVRLSRSLRRLQDPPTYEGAAHESDPEAKAGHCLRRRHAPLMGLHHLCSGSAARVEIPQHLRVGIQLDLQLEVIVAKRHELDASRVEHWLWHVAMVVTP